MKRTIARLSAAVTKKVPLAALSAFALGVLAVPLMFHG